MDERDRISHYQANYLADYGFEAVMVAMRQRAVLESLEACAPSVVIEIGGGAEMLHAAATDQGMTFERWVLVEPADRFCEIARAYAADRSDFAVVQGFLEASADAALEVAGRNADLVIASGLLHEIAEPPAFLAAARRLVGPCGIIHVNVPNAASLHRRLAQAMGLTASIYDQSERQKKLNQPRIFDRDSLAQIVTDCGFQVVRSGGYFVKPFTHAQMESIRPILDESVLDGLWRLGRDHPELASEIFVDACLAIPSQGD